MSHCLRVVRDAETLARRAAEDFARLARAHVAAKGWFAVALSGGSTPKAMYQVLHAASSRARLPWTKIHVFFGDERNVPPDHQDSNFKLASDHLLSKVGIPAENIFRIAGESADPAGAAADYETRIKSFFATRGQTGLPRFDLIFLGMGADGHTASLFPGSSAASERQKLVAATWVEKFKTHRITMTSTLINAASQVTFLCGGDDKADMLRNVLGRTRSPDLWPSQLISPQSGRLDWLCDEKSSRLVRPSGWTANLAPSVLAADFLHLGEGIRAVESGGADRIHVDVMDGRFVPNISLGLPVIESMRRGTTLPLECHLMIQEPERYIEDFVAAGADSLLVHQENQPHLHRTLQLIRSFGVRAGVVLNPATPIETLDEVLGDVDLVLLMSVNPGFGGQKFIESTLRKLSALRRRIDAVNPFCEIEVDGGIGGSTIRRAYEAGADVFVAGTAVFAHKDGPAAGVKSLLAVCRVPGDVAGT